MSKLSRKTRLYIISLLTAGSILLAVSLRQLNVQHDWLPAVILSVLGALSLLFRVEGSTNRTHYDVTFTIYGFTLILFGAPVAVIVIVMAHVLEWIWHKYPWYIQLFNIASYIIVAVAANITYELLNPARSLGTWQGALSMLAAMAVFTLLNHAMVGLIVWLARGENFAQSGIFQFFALMLDYVLLCMGAGAAVVWAFNPLAITLILLSLYLIYSTLRVPALERQTEMDSKTGLFNHKYFIESLEAELRRANRFDHPLTVVMADLDLLRNINNTYGHLAGDEVLMGVAKILKELAREYDVVARFGGEEFAVLMPETTPEEAYPLVQDMRIAVENAAFNVPTSVTPIKVTMSFGVAGREDGLDARGMIHNSDLALYHAKLKGRNRAFIYSNEGYEDLFQPVSEAELATSYPIAARAGGARPAASRVSATSEAPTRPLPRKKNPAEAAPEPGGSSYPAAPGHAKRWVNVYIFAIALVGVALFSLSLWNLPPVNWIGILIFALLVGTTEWVALDIYVRNTSVSTSAVPLIAAILLFGPVGALVMGLTVAAVALIKHHSPFSRFIFNAGNQLLAGMLCILLVNAAGLPYTGWPLLAQLAACAAAAVFVYLLTSFFVAAGIALNFGAPVQQIWKEQFSWLAPYYLAMGAMAYALIFGFLHFGIWSTVIILIPLALMRTSQKQFIERTKEAVNELKVKNRILEEHSGEITRLNNGLLDTLAEIIDLRDPYVLGHSRRVTRYAVMIAWQLGLPAEQIETIRKASLMHDLGKLGIDAGLLSKPTSLSEDEFDTVKRHVTVGAELLRKSQSLESLIPIVLHHHEHYDGNGYPGRLRGDEIPLEARIVCLADAVDAMASSRPYRSALGFEAIMAEVRRCSGSQFDPLVVTAFEQIAQTEGPSLTENEDYSGALRIPEGIPVSFDTRASRAPRGL